MSKGKRQTKDKRKETKTMTELRRLFDETIKADAQGNLAKSEEFEMLFYAEAARQNYSFSESIKIWNNFLFD